MIELISSAVQSEWLHKLSNDFLELLRKAILARGKAHVALSGGSTPKSFYSALNKMPLEWDKIEWWVGDERAVPATDASVMRR
jgi:6-phosphogluconolactonase